MSAAPLVFLDTETTGTGPLDEIWELAAVRRDPDGTQTELLIQVDHNLSRGWDLPEHFRVDRARRFSPMAALTKEEAACRVADILSPGPAGERAVIIGANPAFDVRGITALLEQHDLGYPTWHYRPVDVGALAYGYLSAIAGTQTVDNDVHDLLEQGLPWSSDAVSRALGIDPADYARHTAMGDVRWVTAIYDAVTGGAR